MSATANLYHKEFDSEDVDVKGEKLSLHPRTAILGSSEILVDWTMRSVVLHITARAAGHISETDSK